MISEPINLSTGPVGLSQSVMKALAQAPISHRSVEFTNLHHKTTNFLSEAFSVKQTFILTGSGTLANEVMLHEIKLLSGKGIIISNGEFGERITAQAQRNNLNFIVVKEAWGAAFNLTLIEQKIKDLKLSWLLFCHCETSTGMINNLQELIRITNENGCKCFADCMSTVGVVPMDLSGVAMATASSGKGLASIPGIAIIFIMTKHRKLAPPSCLQIITFAADYQFTFM